METVRNDINKNITVFLPLLQTIQSNKDVVDVIMDFDEKMMILKIKLSSKDKWETFNFVILNILSEYTEMGINGQLLEPVINYINYGVTDVRRVMMRKGAAPGK